MPGKKLVMWKYVDHPFHSKKHKFLTLPPLFLVGNSTPQLDSGSDVVLALKMNNSSCNKLTFLTVSNIAMNSGSLLELLEI